LPENLEVSARNGNLLVIENKMTHFSRVHKVTGDCCPCHIRSSERLWPWITATRAWRIFIKFYVEYFE